MSGLVWKYVKWRTQSFTELYSNRKQTCSKYWHSNVLLLCVCVCARVCARVHVKADIPGWQAGIRKCRAGSLLEWKKKSGVKIMKQKILNNLFSLSTVVHRMAYTFQFKLQDNRGKWMCQVSWNRPFRASVITKYKPLLPKQHQCKLLFIGCLFRWKYSFSWAAWAMRQLSHTRGPLKPSPSFTLSWCLMSIFTLGSDLTPPHLSVPACHLHVWPSCGVERHIVPVKQ